MVSDGCLVLQCMSPVQNPAHESDGSIAGKPIALSLAAPSEQLVEDLRVSEHTSKDLQ